MVSHAGAEYIQSLQAKIDSLEAEVAALKESLDLVMREGEEHKIASRRNKVNWRDAQAHAVAAWALVEEAVDERKDRQRNVHKTLDHVGKWEACLAGICRHEDKWLARVDATLKARETA